MYEFFFVRFSFFTSKWSCSRLQESRVALKENINSWYISCVTTIIALLVT